MQLPKPAPEAVQRFDQLTPADERVTVRKMFGQPSAFVNGNLFFGVFGTRLIVRLSEEDRAAADRIPGFTAFEPMPGRAMRDYRVLPTPIAESPARAREWVARALRGAADLPSKRSKGQPRASGVRGRSVR
jgi:TfoX/Sxy family transcriptional regulator of competence genes